jgi:natural product biosynthesis luciferase-like monooxygenase protein
MSSDVVPRESEVSSQRFWLKTLKDESHLLTLPFYDVLLEGDELTSHNYALTPKQYSVISDACKGKLETESLFLLTILKITLYKYYGSASVSLWMPPKENTPEQEDAWRLITSELLPEQTFRENFRAVEKHVAQAYSYEGISPSDLRDSKNLGGLKKIREAHNVAFAVEGVHVLPESIDPLNLIIKVCDDHGAKSLVVENGKGFFDAEGLDDFMMHFQYMLSHVLEMKASPIQNLSLWTGEEELKSLQLESVNIEQNDVFIHRFESIANAKPADTALTFAGESLSFAELNAQADRFANQLRDDYKIKSGELIGISMERSEKLVSSILAIWKIGCAYVPIDPALPAQRQLFLLSDSGVKFLIVDAEPEGDEWTQLDLQTILRNEKIEATFEHPVEPASIALDAAAYMIYTSGSTGNPKGVCVSHRNLANFGLGMDAVIGDTMPQRILALTTVSFDISILELFWTLSRGIQVDVAGEQFAQLGGVQINTDDLDVMDFGLFFFSSYKGNGEDNKYDLLLESVKFADQNGMGSVWTPERHFNEFGGLYPNPSVISAALAVLTKNLRIRSGSIVSPLHNDLRIAEEWAVVDNLSNGRVELSFASGWHQDDFTFNPDVFENRQKHMFEQIETVKKLWSGEKISVTNGRNETIEVGTFPRPVQKELPIWVTAANSIDTFKHAGSIGANLLTHLLGQDVQDLTDKIDAYRASLKENGFDLTSRKVSLMLHTYIGSDLETVKELVREPFKDYLKSSLGLARRLVDDSDVDFDSLNPSALDALLDRAFERFFGRNALFGTYESTLPFVQNLTTIGVDEIACLVDFGLPKETVLDGLESLSKVVEAFSISKGQRKSEAESQPKEIKPDLLQATPTFLKIMLDRPEGFPQLEDVKTILVGGEPIDLSLVERIQKSSNARVVNVYGPTETTIWSSSYTFPESAEQVLIGQPLLNTRIYVLDQQLNKLPAGATGELYIAGEGVASGYHNRPELTETHFLPDPFVKGERMYKTGDLGRLTLTGELMHLGRNDSQVKVRGHRIELGEVETALLKHPEIATTAVKVETINDSVHLVAYVLRDTGLTSGLIRGFLAQHVPDYMIPTHFVGLDEFAVSSNGKLDRKKLPSPNATNRLIASTEYVAPQNEQEQQLVGIWSDLLQMEQVGVTNNFFDLGGNSVMLVDLQARIASQMEIDFQITDLITYPTISDFLSSVNNENAERLSIEGFSPFQFSEDFLIGEGTRQVQVESLNWKLSSEHWNNVKELAKEQGVPTFTILKTCYAFLFMRVLSQRQLPIFAIDTQTDFVNFSTIDFAAANGFDQMVGAMNEIESDHQFPLKSLPELEAQKALGDVYAIMVDKSRCTGKANLNNFFDIVMSVNYSNEEAHFFLDYNKQVLVPAKVEWLQSVFTGMLDKLIKVEA